MSTTNIRRIVAMDIRQAHPNKKAYTTDIYYTKLANQLLDDFARQPIDLGDQAGPIMRYAATLLANYMEDIVADSGQWRSLSALCLQMFGQAVPMYHKADAEYYPDEPSFEAVRFIVWHAATEMDDIWWNAGHRSLRTMATIAFDRLNRTFEQAPVNEELTSPTCYVRLARIFRRCVLHCSGYSVTAI